MNYIEIPLTKCTVFLTEKELVGLLNKDRELYRVSLQRGKAFLRRSKQKLREGEQWKKHEGAFLTRRI